MPELNLDVPEVVPPWLVLKKRHGITAHYDQPRNIMKARYQNYEADGYDEREAVIALIHNLKLEGWESVSINL